MRRVVCSLMPRKRNSQSARDATKAKKEDKYVEAVDRVLREQLLGETVPPFDPSKEKSPEGTVTKLLWTAGFIKEGDAAASSGGPQPDRSIPSAADSSAVATSKAAAPTASSSSSSSASWSAVRSTTKSVLPTPYSSNLPQGLKPKAKSRPATDGSEQTEPSHRG